MNIHRHILAAVLAFIALGLNAQTKFIASGGAGGSGTVTSVAATVPAEITLTGSPVTTTGTLAFTWASALQNRIFAAPCGSNGTPTFRVLCASDIPTIEQSQVTDLVADLLGKAPESASYLTAVQDGLSGAQVLAFLPTGFMKVATATGVVSSQVDVDLGTDTSGGYAASVSEGGPATTATALAANGANCSAGNYPLGVDASGAVETCTAITGGAPFVDTTSIVEGSADATKELRFEVDGFTTGTVRVATPPNENFTMVGEATTQTLTNKTLGATTVTGTMSFGAASVSFAAGDILTFNGTPPALYATVPFVSKRFIWTAGAGSGSGAPYSASGFSGTLFTNEGAAAKNYYQLPAAVATDEVSFVVQDADGIRIVANTGDTVRIGAAVSAAAGFCESTTIGDVVTFTAINATEWVATVVVGAGWGCT